MSNSSSTATSLVGSIRRFGEDGVLYEVLRKNSDTSVEIRVLDTGEQTNYPIRDAQEDPLT